MNVRCPACNRAYQVSDSLVGKSVHCEECREAFAVEDIGGSSPPPLPKHRPSPPPLPESSSEEATADAPGRPSAKLLLLIGVPVVVVIGLAVLLLCCVAGGNGKGSADRRSGRSGKSGGEDKRMLWNQAFGTGIKREESDGEAGGEDKQDEMAWNQIYGPGIEREELDDKVVLLVYFRVSSPRSQDAFEALVQLQDKWSKEGDFTVVASHWYDKSYEAGSFCRRFRCRKSDSSAFFDELDCNFPVFQELKVPETRVPIYCDKDDVFPEMYLYRGGLRPGRRVDRGSSLIGAADSLMSEMRR